MKRLVLDIDGTLTNSIKAVVLTYNEIFDKNVDWRKIKKYNFSCSFEDINLDKLLELFEHPIFFKNLEFYPGALDVLQNLHDYGFTMQTYSAGTEKNKEQKIIMLNELNKKMGNGSGIDFLGWLDCESIAVGKTCQDLSDAIFIDDLAENLRNCNAKEKILFKYENKDYDWNKNWDGLTFHNWDKNLENKIKELGK